MEWEAPEFEYREKGVSWYWVSIIAAALIVGFSVWTHNFLFGLFIVIAEILFIVWGNQVPRMIMFRMSDEDLLIDGTKHYSVKDFESWSATNFGSEWTDILFNFKSHMKPSIKVLIAERHLDEFRTNLKTVLKEVEHEITVVEAIEKLLRF